MASEFDLIGCITCGRRDVDDCVCCPDCGGSGDVPDTIMDKTKNPPRKTTVFPPCDKCGGTGENASCQEEYVR